MTTATYVPLATGPLVASMYNVRVPPDPGVGHAELFHNTLSGAIVELSETEAAFLARFSSGAEQPSTTAILRNLPLVSFLYENGMLVPVGLDEPERVRLERKYWRENREHLDLTICPTLACNFNCTYCFEEKSSLTFRKEDLDATAMFVERIIDEKTRTVVVHWYGGEPTLRVKDIRALTPVILRRVEKVGADFLSEIYTNAWKLDEEMCEILSNECKIRALMISLDGPPDIHNKMRVGKGGIGEFDEIMKRIDLASRYFDVKLRIHCHAGNNGRVGELLEILNELGFAEAEKRHGNALYIHFSKLYDFSEACKHVKEIRIPHAAFGDLQCEYMEQAQDLDFRVNWIPKRVMGKYCNAQRHYAFVLAPGGNLYKCYREDMADAAAAFAHLTDATIADKVIEGSDASDRPECQACVYMPLCSGFCPMSSWAESPCTHLVGNLERRIANVWKQSRATEKTT